MSHPTDLKAEAAAQPARHRHQLCVRLADAIAAKPGQALALGKENVERSASSFADHWRVLLSEGNLQAIDKLLRDDTEATEQLRISQPFAGLLTPAELRQCSKASYEVRSASLAWLERGFTIQNGHDRSGPGGCRPASSRWVAAIKGSASAKSE
jgi:hypothetical protein